MVHRATDWWRSKRKWSAVCVRMVSVNSAFSVVLHTTHSATRHSAHRVKARAGAINRSEWNRYIQTVIASCNTSSITHPNVFLLNKLMTKKISVCRLNEPIKTWNTKNVLNEKKKHCNGFLSIHFTFYSFLYFLNVCWDSKWKSERAIEWEEKPKTEHWTPQIL